MDDFQAYIGPEPVSWGVPQTLEAGDYTVSEDSLPDYTASDWEGDCAFDGSITLAAGEEYECTITNTFEDNVSQEGWCGPGYWKNHPNEADVAAAACGLTMDAKYNDQFDDDVTLSLNGRRNNANPDPTLRDVLDNPQWYGGDAANNVGDLLSKCHPDVDFEQGDERVEDSCPLN